MGQVAAVGVCAVVLVQGADGGLLGAGAAGRVVEPVLAAELGVVVAFSVFVVLVDCAGSEIFWQEWVSLL